MTPIQSKAARAMLGWSLETLAERASLSRQAIHNFENQKASTERSTLEKLENAFEAAGVQLIAGGVRLRQEFVEIYEGDDCYQRILEDAIHVLEAGEEFLASASDERRSTQQVIEKLRQLRGSGVRMRSLIRAGDTFIMGAPEEYRWMPEELFAEGDVKVIFGNSIAYLMSYLGTPRVVKITDKNIAEESRRTFNHLWEGAAGPSVSTSEVFYDESLL